MNDNGHIDMNCSRKWHTGKPFRGGEVGINERGEGGVFLWCKSCRRPYFVSILDIIQTVEHLRTTQPPLQG